ncbi:hypothetical protein IKG60_00265 [Candidatus Saccharibacteria bacterium]|nr:hypothetical protein [Candidatus Saccharibacteria bacterium]
MAKKHKMIEGYKGFEPGMICRGKKYDENAVFAEKAATIGKEGMHFCTHPFDVWEYYSPCGRDGIPNEFAEVEADENLTVREEDCGANIYCTTRLRVKRKISVSEMATEGIERMLGQPESVEASADVAINRLDHSLALGVGTLGDSPIAINTARCAAASIQGPNLSSVVAINAGDYAVAAELANRPDALVGNIGNDSAALSSGLSSITANVGRHSLVSSDGHRSIATNTGLESAVISAGTASVTANTAHFSTVEGHGNYSVVANTGSSSSVVSYGDNSIAADSYGVSDVMALGENSVAVSLGGGRVKGAMGCILVCAELDNCGRIESIQSARVDGVTIKPDVFYRLKNGQFVETPDR